MSRPLLLSLVQRIFKQIVHRNASSKKVLKYHFDSLDDEDGIVYARLESETEPSCARRAAKVLNAKPQAYLPGLSDMAVGL